MCGGGGGGGGGGCRAGVTSTSPKFDLYFYRLTVSMINQPKFRDGEEGLFALFDGGRNDEVTRILSSKIRALIEEELQHPTTGKEYLKYTMLAAHR